VALFIFSAFAPGDHPCADKTKSTSATGECHEEEPLTIGMADQDLASLPLRVVGIGVDTCQGILKGGSRFLEGHPVLGQVRRGLLRIPLEHPTRTSEYPFAAPV